MICFWCILNIQSQEWKNPSSSRPLAKAHSWTLQKRLERSKGGIWRPLHGRCAGWAGSVRLPPGGDGDKDGECNDMDAKIILASLWGVMSSLMMVAMVLWWKWRWQWLKGRWKWNARNEDGSEEKGNNDGDKLCRTKPPGLAMGRRHHTSAQTLQREEFALIYFRRHQKHALTHRRRREIPIWRVSEASPWDDPSEDCQPVFSHSWVRLRIRAWIPEVLCYSNDFGRKSSIHGDGKSSIYRDWLVSLCNRSWKICVLVSLFCL